jgi:hypothetical protein
MTEVAFSTAGNASRTRHDGAGAYSEKGEGVERTRVDCLS